MLGSSQLFRKIDCSIFFDGMELRLKIRVTSSIFFDGMELRLKIRVTKPG
jgi:hypothetical protein